MSMQLRIACRRLPVAGLALVAGLMAAPAIVTAAETYTLGFAEELNGGELALAIGKNQVINTPKPFDQVVIGNPKVADIRPITNRQVLILGKAPGHTNLVFRGAGQDIIAMMDVMVGYDIVAVKRKLREVLPNETGIEVRPSSDYIVLSGEVSSAQNMDMALQIVRSFIPDDAQAPKGSEGGSGGSSAAPLAKDKVINLMQVGGGQQVMLEAKIAEVSRGSLKALGISSINNMGKLPAPRVALDGTLQFNNYNDVAPGLAGTPNAGISTNGSDGALDLLLRGGLAAPFGTVGILYKGINLQLDALEDKGLAKVLAEPNLVALSGQSANFLAGGEFPVPVAQGGAVAGAITVEFKPFGVGLKFTPTVLNSQKINLNLGAEVSSIDLNTGTTINGIRVPGIKTRRANTSVEVADGQSFAIAGLLQNDMGNAVRQFPILGDIPILGSLFRSTEFQRNETELVIIVTPRLVKPVPAGQLKTPTDQFVPPSDFDQYLMGTLEGPRSAAPAPAAKEPGAGTPASRGGGTDGTYGHQL
jgi:pilus assembly protein CpaC